MIFFLFHLHTFSAIPISYIIVLNGTPFLIVHHEMSASPQLQSAPQISSPHAIVRSPSANVHATNSPSYVANAHLAQLLSESYLDIESLRREVAITKKRADKAERLLANYTQATSANGGTPVNILQFQKLPFATTRLASNALKTLARKPTLDDASSQTLGLG
jgi:hypothetical protein